jgi:uncharacterized protein
MPKVIHFEFPALEPDRAIAFYASAFGWTSTDYAGGSEYWICQCGPESEPGINGAIMARRGEGQPVVTILAVKSVDESCAAVVAAGGEIVVPKFEIPGLGFKAFFKDTEGNIVGMAEFPGGDI